MTIIFLLVSYLLGSIPTGYILFLLSEKKDIRSFGSKATGATNVMRVKGWKYGVIVATFDILKGFLPVFLALKFLPNKHLALACGLLAVIGHCYPVYIKFKGGKGVATSIGAYAALSVPPLLLSLVVFIMIVIITRFVSLGSIIAVFSYPIFAYTLKAPMPVVYFSLIVFLLILFQHRENILRLIQGKERKLGGKIK
ncbi:MAG: glycerol-3-phosphate 1-O-acyltransferase PlsY [Candidatus Aminicenantes bacterium]|nr:glycerol-3-phosphate 1-O-acyltransferase PlsY [Candidatus Aminicenantes bacterium]